MPSSVINHFIYDVATKSLTITFVTKMVYVYKNVPNKTFKMLKAAGSRGRFFNYHIKNKFEFEKLEEV